MNDTINRQAAIDAECAVCSIIPPRGRGHNCQYYVKGCPEVECLRNIPSAEPEQFTDKEQRIFLAAMGREEKVCKEVDAEITREPYEDSLVKTCHEIIRKVKGALWTR